jgi:hypothetical protein
MEDDFVVFERLFEKTDSVDGLFIRLTSDKDTRLEYNTVTGISFSESMGNMVPVMIIDFVDGSGDFINHNRLDTDAVYTLYFGRTVEDSYQTKYKIADINTANKTAGRSNNVQFKVIFAHQHWQELTAINRNRGWYDTYYSDVVDEVVADAGFGEVDIEPSKRAISELLQNNKPDNTMIQEIAHSATPESEDGHYEYCGTLDNRFFFLSTATLIEKGIEVYKNDKMPILRLGGNPPPAIREKAFKDNKNIPVGFLGFSINESYMSNVTRGVTSVDVGYYDWEEGKYIRNTRKYTDLKSTQLSEMSLIRESTDFVSRKLYGGRSPQIVDQANNELSMQSLSMQSIDINIEGQIEMHCGDIVEVIIPTGGDSEVPYSEMYSGFYMIREIEHAMSLSRSTDFTSRITISRHGVDSKELKGYVSSKRGRANFVR